MPIKVPRALLAHVTAISIHPLRLPCAIRSDPDMYHYLPWTNVFVVHLHSPTHHNDLATCGFAEDCGVVAEGALTHSGMFQASALGLPPVESREASFAAAKARCQVPQDGHPIRTLWH